MRDAVRVVTGKHNSVVVHEILYVLFIGLPTCLLCVTFGLFLCCTIVFLP